MTKKHYIAQLNERNGDYVYQHTIRLICGDPEAALIDIAKNWYENAEDYLENYGEALHDPENEVQGHFYFNAGGVCVTVGKFTEISQAVFEGLPKFIEIFERD
jgi:hypothetical protein